MTTLSNSNQHTGGRPSVFSFYGPFCVLQCSKLFCRLVKSQREVDSTFQIPQKALRRDHGFICRICTVAAEKIHSNQDVRPSAYSQEEERADNCLLRGDVRGTRTVLIPSNSSDTSRFGHFFACQHPKALQNIRTVLASEIPGSFLITSKLNSKETAYFLQLFYSL